jgi:hypothetical protein
VLAPSKKIRPAPAPEIAKAKAEEEAAETEAEDMSPIVVLHPEAYYFVVIV